MTPVNASQTSQRNCPSLPVIIIFPCPTVTHFFGDTSNIIFFLLNLSKHYYFHENVGSDYLYNNSSRLAVRNGLGINVSDKTAILCLLRFRTFYVSYGKRVQRRIRS